ncbi:hypothetical protein QWY77_06505 [Thalassotalea ponticola]|uniref:hypothetical protein n=1 Tax=Thalassotalea ponticola TaxID=1523392 RepID=UPI0025B3A729|nr:hypothetical protein [Thalassotalea ponticola]MDN3652413.1 hypothetical protein [Thalassotalea ponticola]
MFRTTPSVGHLTILLSLLLLPLRAIGDDSIPLCEPAPQHKNIYYVALDGHDYKGKGTKVSPWRHIEFAVFKAEDDSLIIVKPGVYDGRVKISKAFKTGITIKSEIPYAAKLTANQRVLALVKNASNIRIEGFEIRHKDAQASPVVVHIDAWGTTNVYGISLVNNIIHDSFNNDLLKINYGAHHILVNCNLFYNQGNSDEHIDINSTSHVSVRHNVFFNDFNASNRDITKKSSSYIVIKDSNDDKDRYHGSTNIDIDGNIFFNWQGSHGHGFILVGEDGKPYFEARNINIVNNLLIGNSDISMRSPFAVKGARDINFSHNTVIGDLPSNAYALRISVEGQNQVPTGILLTHNIFSDPTGTMGAGDYQKLNDFSDTEIGTVDQFSLQNNAVFNGPNSIPHSIIDEINASDDANLIHFNPEIQAPPELISPVFIAEQRKFADGSTSIEQVFRRIISQISQPSNVNKLTVTRSEFSPQSDILGRKRGQQTSVGAIQYSVDK